MLASDITNNHIDKGVYDMRQKRLPVKAPNDFIAYKPFDASRIAILLAQETICKELYENFIHFRIEKVVKHGMIDLDCHFNEEFSSIGVKKVPIDVVSALRINFLEFCRISLENDFYIFLPVETSEISNYSVYGKVIVPHHIFIYGYHDEDRSFDCAEFFSFSDEPYSFQQVTYQEMEAAFLKLQTLTSSKSMTNEWAQWMKDIQLLHSFTEYKDKSTIKRVMAGLQNYLRENDCFGNKGFIEDVYYGFAIYDLTVEYIEQAYEYHRINLDTRSFSLLYYRFHYMKLQVEFIIKHYKYSDNSLQSYIAKYLELKNIAQVLLNISMKYRLQNDKNMLVRMKERLLKLKAEDKHVTADYIKCLEFLK